MTIDEAKKRIKDVSATFDDDLENGHIAEDEFLADVLRHIADGGRDAQALAALTVAALDEWNEHPHWYA